MGIEVARFESSQVFKKLCASFYKLAKKSIAKSGKFNVAFSGGNSPLNFFRELTDEQNRASVEWSNINVFWVDERYVPRTSSESNYGMALKNGLNLTPLNCFPIDTELNSVHDSIDSYNGKLKSLLGDTPVLDYILLGAGTDHHTASLFQQNMNMVNNDANVVQTVHPESKQVRISLNFNMLIGSTHIDLLLLGESKRPVLSRLLAQDRSRTPIEYVASKHSSIRIITDIYDRS